MILFQSLKIVVLKSRGRSSDSRGDDTSSQTRDGRCVLIRLSKPCSEFQVPPTRPLHERMPHSMHQVVLDEQVPDAIRTFVEIRHRRCIRPAPSDARGLGHPSHPVSPLRSRSSPAVASHGIKRASTPVVSRGCYRQTLHTARHC